MGIEIEIPAWQHKLMQGLKGSVSTKRRAAATALLSISAFLLTVFSASPQYSTQMLFAGTEYWQLAFITRFSGMYSTAGITGIILTAVFSVLAGVSITNTAVQLKMNQVSLDSLGALPGFMAAGCASCGVGLLSVLGLGGVLASMPLQGNLLRLGGVLLLLILIARTGDPENCRI